jgi:hypothetical protein
MKGTGILETMRNKEIRKNSSSFLLIEQLMIEERFGWLKCRVMNDTLTGVGFLSVNGGQTKYKIFVEYSYKNVQRYDRIWVVEPYITFNPKTHMYANDTLCLYHPDDLPFGKITPLAVILPWVSEWLVKYEFWKKYKVWIGEEAPH